MLGFYKEDQEMPLYFLLFHEIRGSRITTQNEVVDLRSMISHAQFASD